MKLSLRTQFLIPSLLIIFIILGSANIISYFTVRDIIYKTVMQEMEQTVFLTLKNLSRWMENIKLDLIEWSHQTRYQLALEDSYLGRAAREAASFNLKQMKDHYGYYISLNLADMKGNVISSSEDNIIYYSVFDRQFFRESLGGNYYISEVTKSEDLNQDVFIISVPVVFKDMVVGVLYGEIDLKAFNNLFIAPLKIGKTGYVYLTMEDGYVIAPPDKLKDLKSNASIFSQIPPGGKQGRAEESSREGRIIFSQKDSYYKWTLNACISKEELMAPSHRISYISSLTAAFSVLLFILLIMYMYRRIILVPMQNLITGIHDFEKGNFTKKIKLKSQGKEFDELIDSFNTMVDSLNKSMVSIEELEKSQRRFQDVTKSIGDWVWEVDREGRYTYSNAAVEDILRYKPEEVLGKHFYDFSYGDEQEKLKKILSEDFPPGGEFKNFLNKNIRKNGQLVILETTGVPVVDKNGTFLGYRGVSRDITERQKAEEKQKELIGSLSQINKQLDDFTYIVSHDLKEPLRAIDAFSKFVWDDYFDKFDEEGKGYLKRIRANAVRMQNLIEDLLNISRIARKKIPFEEVQVESVLKEVELRLDYAMKEKNVKIIIQDKLPTVFCDRLRFTEVFVNLLSNAIKFNDKPQPIIEVGCKERESFYEFFVKDNGPGIEEKYFDKIFQIFQRLGKREERDGTGAGLTIVKKIIQMHKGDIWVESKVGEGTTFYFTIFKEIGILKIWR